MAPQPEGGLSAGGAHMHIKLRLICGPVRAQYRAFLMLHISRGKARLKAHTTVSARGPQAVAGMAPLTDLSIIILSINPLFRPLFP